jgi:hypothetical protein
LSESTRARLERLRGSLEPEEPGARGLERVARNPECGLLTALTIAGTTPATAAESAFGELAEEGQSPFALAMGNRFEKYRFDTGEPIYSRDCPEYAVTTPTGERIWVLPNHFKSKFGGNDPASIAKRKA